MCATEYVSFPARRELARRHCRLAVEVEGCSVDGCRHHWRVCVMVNGTVLRGHNLYIIHIINWTCFLRYNKMGMCVTPYIIHLRWKVNHYDGIAYGTRLPQVQPMNSHFPISLFFRTLKMIVNCLFIDANRRNESIRRNQLIWCCQVQLWCQRVWYKSISVGPKLGPNFLWL